MSTSKPISTISYNSEEFLKDKLDQWLKAHIIQTYMYIKHKGEYGDKDHIHLRIEPNKKLDPMDLQEDLKEFVPECSKPLGCRPFRLSSEEDWYLYVVHDVEYLKIKYGGGDKGEKMPYKWQDIIVPEDYDVECAFIRAKAKLAHTSVSLCNRIKSGSSPMQLIMEGENVYKINALMHALNSNDYQRLQSRYVSLVQAVESAGFIVKFDDENNCFLE